MGRAHEVRKASMAKTAAAKAAVYGRAAKEVYIAAKQGGQDPNANLALRSAIDKAKTKQVPADVIDRAIKRAVGGINENYVFNRYEGYGPGNTAIIVESLTTNVNRAIAEIRDVFNKNEGKLGSAGSVLHLFKNVALFEFPNYSVEEILELLLEKEAIIDDVVAEDDEIVVYAPFTSFNNVKTILDDFGIKDYKTAETTFLPNDESISLSDENRTKLNKLLTKLDELEDVQAIYHNAI